MKLVFLANKYMALGDAVFEVIGTTAQTSTKELSNILSGYSQIMLASDVGKLSHISQYVSNHYYGRDLKDACSIFLRLYYCKCVYTAVLHDIRPTDNHKSDWYLTGIICSERRFTLAPRTFFIGRPD